MDASSRRPGTQDVALTATADYRTVSAMEPAAGTGTVAPTYRGVLHASWLLVYLTAALSLFAGYVHVAYVDSHLREWWAYGAFFIAAANLQVLFAALLVRWPRAWLPYAGIAGNLAIISMYFITRTSGIPLGPHKRVVEEAGATDWATTAAQVGIIIALLAMLDGRPRRWIINGLLLLGAVAWVLRLTGHLQ
jgi:hypothetical protein